MALALGDVVSVPALGIGKVFQVSEIQPDGRVSGPAVSIRWSDNGVEIFKVPKGVADLFFHGFDPWMLELIHRAPQAKA